MGKLFLLFCIIQLKAHAQDLQNQELKYFLSYVVDSVIRKEVYEDGALVIANKTINITKLNDLCLKSIASIDSLKQSEIKYLTEKADTVSSLFLSNENIGESNAILSNSFKKNLTWRDRFCTVSDPIFIRDYNYCLFGYDLSKEGGAVILFKKEQLKWKIVKSVCAWYY